MLSSQEPPGEAASGRGLLIVARMATRWTVTRASAHRETVWAELHLR
ncbi:hypothetical protein [Streptomyces sp. 8N706]